MLLCAASLLATAIRRQAWASAAKSVSLFIPFDSNSSWTAFATAGFKIQETASDAYKFAAAANENQPDSFADFTAMKKLGKNRKPLKIDPIP